MRSMTSKITILNQYSPRSSNKKNVHQNMDSEFFVLHLSHFVPFFINHTNNMNPYLGDVLYSKTYSQG